MKIQTEQQCTAFGGFSHIASGNLSDVAYQVKSWLDKGNQAAVLIFDTTTSAPIEIDFRGTLEQVQERLLPSPPLQTEIKNPRTPGRPKLGVISREVTLLPRHWQWLQSQPGGASVTLRKLVDAAKKENAPNDVMRHSRDACYGFMVALAGNLPGFEEATRALFSGNRDKFLLEIQPWPSDVQKHICLLAKNAFTSSEPMA